MLCWEAKKPHSKLFKVGPGAYYIVIGQHCITLYCISSTEGRNIDLEVHIDTTNLSNAFVECTLFQSGYNCTIEYGTDPSYTNLVNRDTSSTLGRTATIILSQELRGDTSYYYIVSAESSSQCVRVQGRFRVGRSMSFAWCHHCAASLSEQHIVLIYIMAHKP